MNVSPKHINFERNTEPKNAMDIGLNKKVKEIFNNTWNNAYSAELYYNEVEWKKIITFLLLQDIAPEKVEHIVRSKLMRYIGQEHETGKTTFEDFKNMIMDKEKLINFSCGFNLKTHCKVKGRILV